MSRHQLLRAGRLGRWPGLKQFAFDIFRHVALAGGGVQVQDQERVRAQESGGLPTGELSNYSIFPCGTSVR